MKDDEKMNYHAELRRIKMHYSNDPEERRKYLRIIRRWKLWKWKLKHRERIPQVFIDKNGWQKCPACGCDVGSVWPPNPIIRMFRKPKEVVHIFRCLKCGLTCADYCNSSWYVKC